MFRAEIKTGTVLGKTVSEIMARGGLVSDELVNDIVASRTMRPDCANGFLLDGYPRTVPQARVFGALLGQRKLTDPIVIHLDVADGPIGAGLKLLHRGRRALPVDQAAGQAGNVDGRVEFQFARQA